MDLTNHLRYTYFDEQQSAITVNKSVEFELVNQNETLDFNKDDKDCTDPHQDVEDLTVNY